jgi:hypothetical protein
MVMTAARFFSGRSQLKDELAFWDRIRLPNKTWRTTTKGRFDDLNAQVAAEWRQSEFVPHRALDIAVSSGITSLEWLQAMEAEGFRPRMTATDIALDALLVEYRPFYRVLVLDTPEREPLQHDLFGVAVCPFLQLSGTLPLRVVAMAVHRAVRGTSPASVKPVKLVSPEAVRRIDFIEDDLFDAGSKPRLGAFDVIRAANILNRNYFAETKLKEALLILRSLLAGEGSRLIVARTLTGGANHGTMFRLGAEGRLDPVMTIGEGSEIADLVTAMPARS